METFRTWEMAFIAPTEDTHSNMINWLARQNKLDWWTPSEGENRRIQGFYINSGVVTIRSSIKPPEGVNEHCIGGKIVEKEHCISNGDKVRLRVRISVSFGEKYKAAAFRQMRLEKMKQVLEKKGCQVEFADFEPFRTYTKKNKRVLNMTFNDVFAKVTITDEKLFADAVKHGVGRHKAYGAGMIRYEKLPNISKKQ